MIKTSMLPIIVTHRVRVVEHDGVHYVRTRDVSDVLGIKQPFEFTSDIKKSLGEHQVLKGEDTFEFREDTDNSRTPYITVLNMIEFLNNGILKHRTNGTTQDVIETLERFMNSSK